jgi:hypothetical protein
MAGPVERVGPDFEKRREHRVCLGQEPPQEENDGDRQQQAAEHSGRVCPALDPQPGAGRPERGGGEPGAREQVQENAGDLGLGAGDGQIEEAALGRQPTGRQHEASRDGHVRHEQP